MSALTIAVLVAACAVAALAATVLLMNQIEPRGPRRATYRKD